MTGKVKGSKQDYIMIQDEEQLSKIRAIELWDNHILDTFEAGTLKGLQDIHRYLFQDVFDFAGQMRTVNLSKGNFRFAPVLFLDANLQIIDAMKSETFDDIIEKYVEMNVAHPFREGIWKKYEDMARYPLKKTLK